MHGAGNDFVLLDYRHSGESLDAGTAAHIADRRRGVGCDQVLVLKASDKSDCAARYEVFNSDGSPAGQCGNGVRCIALYLQQCGEFGAGSDAGDSPGSQVLHLEGPSGVVKVKSCADGEFECAMGEPLFDLSAVPVEASHARAVTGGHRLTLEVDGKAIEVGTVSMGNPHAVMTVPDVVSAEVTALGPEISRHSAFPDGCNAGFAQVLDAENIRLRVHERGAGETLACGSGACAAVAVLKMNDRVASAVNVFLPGGHLVIKWDGPGNEMTMKGPAAHVFRGTLGE